MFGQIKSYFSASDDSVTTGLQTRTFITNMNLNHNSDHNHTTTSPTNVHKIQIYTTMIIIPIPRDQRLIVLFYVMNFMYWNKLLQLGSIISTIIQLLLIKIIHENQDDNNNGNPDSHNNNINDDIESANNTNNENKESDDDPKQQLNKLKTNEETIWFHIAHYNISQFYL